MAPCRADISMESMTLPHHPLLDRARRFLEEITQEDKVAVIHHTDTDGISSGAVLFRGVEKLRGRGPDLTHNQASSEHSLTPSTLRLLRERKINKVLITDIASDEGPETLKQLAEFAQILVIDHHKVKHQFDSRNIIVIKPQLLSSTADPAKYCCAKFAYDILEPLVDMSDCDWIACAGVIGDMTAVAWRDFVTEVHRKYGAHITENLFDSMIGKVAVYLKCTEDYDIGLVQRALQIVLGAGKPDDVLHSELHAYYLKVQAELKDWLDNLEHRAKRYPGLILYPVQPKYNIKSALSTILSTRFPHDILVLYTSTGEKTYFSLRCHDYGTRVNDLIEYATRGLRDATGGGHIPAAGGTVHTTDLPVAKARIIEAVEKKLFRNK